jgi:signal-transduction protein with cAMP-binding, CBS, and nucleotidyltransferase domain
MLTFEDDPMQTGYKVMDVMTNKPIVANKELALKDAAKLMSDSNVHSLLITEGESAIGIVTDEDMVRKIIAKGLDIKKMRLKDIMETDLVSILPNKDIYDALLLMRDNNIRQLPVISGGKLQGFLTSKDILKIEPELIDLMVEKYEIREQPRKVNYDDEFSDIIKRKK